MGKLAEKKVALAARILNTDDERVLRSIDEVLDRAGAFSLSTADLAELDAIRERHLTGQGNSSSWADVKKRIRKRMKP
ncbi:MAG: hypothetical protein R2811_10455 [Flavobacteriales bacterium]